MYPNFHALPLLRKQIQTSHFHAYNFLNLLRFEVSWDHFPGTLNPVIIMFDYDASYGTISKAGRFFCCKWFASTFCCITNKITACLNDIQNTWTLVVMYWVVHFDLSINLVSKPIASETIQFSQPFNYVLKMFVFLSQTPLFDWVGNSCQKNWF